MFQLSVHWSGWRSVPPQKRMVAVPTRREELVGGKKKEAPGERTVVGGSKGKHSGSGGTGVGANSVRDVGERVLPSEGRLVSLPSEGREREKTHLDVVLVVEDLSSPVCLDEDVAAGKEPSEGEKVGGKSLREDVETDGPALARVELVGGVVLSGVVDVSSPVASSDL
jgi:hypothetical protein